jgi:co-chaperonin GroES (HSP10)
MNTAYDVKHVKIRTLHDWVIVSDMNFGETVTKSGIVLRSDNAKSHGVKPRWGKVYCVGPEQKDVKVGDWILVEHGRWTRAAKINDGEQELIIHRVDTEGILASSEQAPSADDVVIGHSI